MSLLWMDYESEFQDLVDTAFQCEREDNPDYFSSLSKRVQKIIHRDTRYNVDFLYTSYVLKDDKIMENYSVWLFQLMDSVLKNNTASQTAQYVINHLEYIKQGVTLTVGRDKQEDLLKLLSLAQECIRKADSADFPEESADTLNSRYEAEIQQYMQSLFDKNMRRTLYLIQQFTEKGIPVTDIYAEILTESMRRVGEMWHTAQITVDTEHYCTSVTQMAMSQMYPSLFTSERRNRTILCACPGTELHEMGARMVADIFENDGWDSMYLGAAVPQDAMLDSIRENRPDLIALSVTMPQHLLACRDLIIAIREEFPDAVIAVGGNAFRNTHDIWSQWPVDIYTTDARDLLKKADSILCKQATL